VQETGIAIDAVRPEDWPRVAEIHAEGIATGDATFETEVPSWERWDADHLPGHRHAARDGDRILGWATLSRVSTRDVYRGVAECSVYVAQEARGRGVGELLLDALVEGAEAGGIGTPACWSAEARSSEEGLPRRVAPKERRPPRDVVGHGPARRTSGGPTAVSGPQSAGGPMSSRRGGRSVPNSPDGISKRERNRRRAAANSLHPGGNSGTDRSASRSPSPPDERIGMNNG
jgi:L-amino acid N-acyltransferase YncA